MKRNISLINHIDSKTKSKSCTYCRFPGKHTCILCNTLLCSSCVSNSDICSQTICNHCHVTCKVEITVSNHAQYYGKGNCNSVMCKKCIVKRCWICNNCTCDECVDILDNNSCWYCENRGRYPITTKERNLERLKDQTHRSSMRLSDLTFYTQS